MARSKVVQIEISPQLTPTFADPQKGQPQSSQAFSWGEVLENDDPFFRVESAPINGITRERSTTR